MEGRHILRALYCDAIAGRENPLKQLTAGSLRLRRFVTRGLHYAMPLRGCRVAAAASNSRPMSYKRDYRPSHSSPLPLSLPSLFSMFFRRFQGHFSGQIAATASRMRENRHFALLRMYIHGRQNMPQMGRFCAFPILWTVPHRLGARESCSLAAQPRHGPARGVT